MKKFFALLCLAFVSNPVFAEQIFKSRLIIMRHGYALSNERGVFNTHPKNPGYEPMPLTEKGVRQAYDGGHKLNSQLQKDNVNIDKVFYSPLPRAKETAFIVGHVIGLNVDLFEETYDIIENDMGLLEGHPYADYPFEHSDLSHNHDPRIQGEDTKDVKTRLQRFLFQKIAPLMKNNKTVLVVTHGTPALFLSRMLGEKKGVSLDNADFVVYEIGISKKTD